MWFLFKLDFPSQISLQKVTQQFSAVTGCHTHISWCGYHSGDDLPSLPHSQLYRSYNTHDPLPAGGAAVQLVGVLEGDHSLLEPHDLDTSDSQHSAQRTLPRRCHRHVAHLLRGLLEPPLLGAEIVLVDAGGPAHRGPGGGAQGGRGRGGAEGGEHEAALGA